MNEAVSSKSEIENNKAKFHQEEAAGSGLMENTEAIGCQTQ